MTDVVVLGWDALDDELMDAFNLSDAFGEHRETIETHVNPVIDEPHTKELWPSMITGLTPDEHGIVWADESNSVDWENDLIDMASDVANEIVPHSIRYAVGRRLRERGADLASRTRGYYRRNGIDTVFERQDSRAISIPNYRTATDEAAGLDAGRDELWAELEVDRSVSGGIEPTVSAEAVNRILGDALGRRVGQTISAIRSDYPLIWTWFGLIDSVGHMDPAVPTPLQREGYETAAEVTQMIRDLVDDETTVIAVSDHGLQDGSHTHYATIACDEWQPVNEIDSIFDIAGWIDSNCRKRQQAASTGATDTEAVRDQLDHLGYI